MSGHIYILTDGINTKIGITIALDKRMSSYNTHNPNFYNYKTYSCSIEEAKKIESVIKLFFKDKLSGSSKEWFSTQPEEINQIVLAFLQKPVEESITPAMHGIKLPEQGYILKEKILEAMNGRKTPKEDVYGRKEAFAEFFASSFKLGIPQHRLPEDIALRDDLSIDLEHCDKTSDIAKIGVKQNFIKFPYDDHPFYFYHLVKLASGSFVAVCTSRISMPYLKAIEGKKNEIMEAANQAGLYAFFHHEWSWHFPKQTGLILYMQKTPVSTRMKQWDTSLRKWVIERSKILEQENFRDKDTLEKTIGDLSNDNTFPLNVNSCKELYDNYFEPFWGLKFDDEEPHFMIDAYKFIFNKWTPNR
jgi:hypothetical protein